MSVTLQSSLQKYSTTRAFIRAFMAQGGVLTLTALFLPNLIPLSGILTAPFPFFTLYPSLVMASTEFTWFPTNDFDVVISKKSIQSVERFFLEMTREPTSQGGLSACHTDHSIGKCIYIYIYIYSKYYGNNDTTTPECSLLQHPSP